ncbi:PREDICTED: uncharacterized protein LOC108762544, partial [Trachymyrmex cornetzi]|uniref:uncharacterized protein LOC108762544 n=1 Tax=Trachymyrmex cornetzi TaxID=471704 RepID=UPI00084EF6FB
MKNTLPRHKVLTLRMSTRKTKSEPAMIASEHTSAPKRTSVPKRTSAESAPPAPGYTIYSCQNVHPRNPHRLHQDIYPRQGIHPRNPHRLYQDIHSRRPHQDIHPRRLHQNIHPRQ